jgi:hypothetical protein
MTNKRETSYVVRDKLLGLLSDEEIALVSTAETAPRLSHGDDYVDLEDLGRGVQRATGATVATGRLLPRKAVHEDTWTKVVAELGAFHVASAHYPA